MPVAVFAILDHLLTMHIFDPLNHVSQQLQKAPSVHGKRSSTSYLSHITSLTCP